MIWLYTLTSVLIVSSISLIGITTFALSDKVLNKVLIFFVAFSSGALIGDSFLHLLPRASENDGFNNFVAFSILAGIMTFFVLEKFLRWRHCHEVECYDHPKHMGTLNLLSDGVHNFIDGALIGASFIVAVPLGIATTMAVVFHEIPHELGNFAILLHSGYTRKRAIFYNFISASAAILGALIALYLGGKTESFEKLMVPFTAGSFLYIAMTDLIPELHKELKWQKNLLQMIFIGAGIGLMYLFLFFE